MCAYIFVFNMIVAGVVMDKNRDSGNHRNNAMYYNQMLRENRTVSSDRKQRVVSVSFSSQKVYASDYVFAVEGYEGIFYTLYFFTIPYIAGAIFLFLFIAKADYENFMLLDTSAFFIVWMIGYEIIATLLLIAIFISFLRYDKKPKKRY